MNRLNIGINDLKNVAKNIKPDVLSIEYFNKALDEIQERVKSKLIENLAKYDLIGSGIERSVRVYRIKNKIYVEIANNYAIFVEYGTGIIGSENPHPNPAAKGWIYDKNNKGEDGWWYPCDEEIKSRYPYIRTRTINGILYAHTKGQRSRPFVYETYLFALGIITPTLEKYLREQLIDIFKV